ncbi:hypothetical protein [Acinetobacter zhairhuonensis]|uniref:hypothetical protein n=1 Tax=Acinetobacter sp. A7.4 TaxID=2919921 RepID=UPI001F4D58EF|nr:hypothetical protein [Acinetobacter sp. A7.4]MCJ8161149.1 hypothetical protein [Acinetobacter sp. A7.4]
MKKIIMCCCFLYSGTLFASMQDNISLCEAIAIVAGNVMQERQDEVPLLAQKQIALEYDDGARDLYEAIVEDAYDLPILPNDSQKQQAVQSFKLEYFDYCEHAEVSQ